MWGRDELNELGQRYFKYIFPQKVGAWVSHVSFRAENHSRLNKQTEKQLLPKSSRITFQNIDHLMEWETVQ